jgi:hypothetical protein
VTAASIATTTVLCNIEFSLRADLRERRRRAECFGLSEFWETGS